jgi:MFS family permease
MVAYTSLRSGLRLVAMSNRHSKWLVFACVAIAQFMVILDVTVINVALPVIKVRLHFGNAAIGWVVTAYVLTFGGFLLFGGRAADLLGRRRMLLVGMVAFTACSFLVGISPDPALLVVLRGAQGLSAALMSPAALSIVLATFSEGPERNQALGYWSVVATAGAAVGLLLGGVLTSYAGWRWNFFINVPVGVVMSVMIARVVPAYEHEGTRSRLDIPGAVLATAGLMAAVLYLSQSPDWGWLDARTLPALAGALVLLALFVMNYSAIGTGIAILPVPVVMSLVAVQMRRLIARHGYRRYLILGPALVAAGMAWACLLPAHGNYPLHLLPGLLVMPVGYGMSYPSAYAAATSGVPARQAGLASGLINTAQQMGGAVGLAIVSAVAASYTASLTRDSGPQALTSGYNLAMAVAAGLTLLASVIAATVIRVRRPASAGPPPPDRRPPQGWAHRRNLGKPELAQPR